MDKKWWVIKTMEYCTTLKMNIPKQHNFNNGNFINIKLREKDSQKIAFNFILLL